MESLKNNRVKLLLASCKELSNARQLALCAMCLALSVVLGRLSIYLTPTIKLSVAYLPFALAGFYAGPLAALLVGALNDLIGAFLFPVGAYFPGYTLTAALTGLVFGLGFYKARPTLLRVAMTRAVVVLFLHMGLNTLWSSLFMGDSFWVLLPGRALKSLIQYPVDVLLLYLLLKLVPRIRLGRGEAARPPIDPTKR